LKKKRHIRVHKKLLLTSEHIVETKKRVLLFEHACIIKKAVNTIEKYIPIFTMLNPIRLGAVDLDPWSNNNFSALTRIYTSIPICMISELLECNTFTSWGCLDLHTFVTSLD